MRNMESLLSGMESTYRFHRAGFDGDAEGTRVGSTWSKYLITTGRLTQQMAWALPSFHGQVRIGGGGLLDYNGTRHSDYHTLAKDLNTNLLQYMMLVREACVAAVHGEVEVRGQCVVSRIQIAGASCCLARALNLAVDGRDRFRSDQRNAKQKV